MYLNFPGRTVRRINRLGIPDHTIADGLFFPTNRYDASFGEAKRHWRQRLRKAARDRKFAREWGYYSDFDGDWVVNWGVKYV